MGRPVIKKIVNLDIVGVNGMFGRRGGGERRKKIMRILTRNCHVVS